MLKKQERLILAPASIPQEQFLASDSTITLYNGSAGAGKSFAIILNMIKFAAKRNSTIIVFRRTAPEFRIPGGLWKEAPPLFRRMFPDCRIKDRDMEISIPSTNSVVKFMSLQYISDVEKVLGSQLSAIFFDEAVTFEPFETFILPLLGRLRNADVDYAPQMFWATNPKFNHGIYHWIKDFYLDSEGIPLPEKSNVVRWFVIRNDKPLWFDVKEDCEEYCKRISVPGQEPIKPRTFRSIRAHVTDNIPLMRNNPDYIQNLQSLSEVKRRIYLDGSWTAREEESGYFKREFCKTILFPSPHPHMRVRSWDLAATLPSTASPDPDWTRGVLMSKDREGIYTIEDIQSLRDRPHAVEKLVLETAQNDPPNTLVVIPCDPGQAGIAYSNGLKVKLAELGIPCKIVKANKSKLLRFKPFSSLSEAGVVRFVKAEWLDEAYEELENFNGAKNNGHDDICDAISDAVFALNTRTEIPDFSLPDLTGTNPFSGLIQQNQTFQSLPSF